MDWIHCNVCYIQPSEGKAFSITSCGHMYCCDCVRNGTQGGKCLICKSECTVIQLVADMKDEVKEFFMEPDEMLSKLMRLLEFQKQHRMRLTTYWISLNRKYKEARNELKRMNEISAKMYEDMKEIHAQNKVLKAALASYANNEKKSPFSVPRSTCVSMPTSASSQRLMSSYSTDMNSGKNYTPKVFQSTLVTPLRLHKPQSNKHGVVGCKRSRKSGYGPSYVGPSSLLSPQSINGNTPGSGYITTPPSVYSHRSSTVKY